MFKFKLDTNLLVVTSNFQYNELHTCITMNGYPQAPVRGVEPKTSEGSGVHSPHSSLISAEHLSQESRVASPSPSTQQPSLHYTQLCYSITEL